MKDITKALLQVRKFKKTYDSQIETAVKPFALSRTEADILLFLNNHPTYDTARDIVELRGLVKSNVSQAVESLSCKQMLSQVADTQDRRMIHLRLLPAAKAPLQAAIHAQRAFLCKIYHGITAKERRELERILEKVSANLEGGQ